jgi:xanthine/uracil/vitamin C permease (AzgA family)
VAPIPAQAYGPALILVGLFMLDPISRINFADYSEFIPSFIVVALIASPLISVLASLLDLFSIPWGSS